MTSCPAETDLLLLVDGDVDVEAATPLLDHLQECADCRAALAHAEAALCYALGGLADQERVAEPAPVRPLRRRVAWAAGIAAAVVLAVTLARPAAERNVAQPTDVARSEPGMVDPAPETLEERVDRLLVEARALSTPVEAEPAPVEELAAFAAARTRVDLLGAEAGRAALLDVIRSFPGTEAAERARSEIAKLGDDR